MSNVARLRANIPNLSAGAPQVSLPKMYGGDASGLVTHHWGRDGITFPNVLQEVYFFILFLQHAVRLEPVTL